MNIDPRIDLALIFERDDVRAAMAGHCAKTHAPESSDCPSCLRLIVILANAIIEWRDGCELAATMAAEDTEREHGDWSK